ncbi:MAG TPA: glucoamylase family protein, partial [Chloroflexota bacterium]|nr:glucoamylase family protein [Chloroflexota bacterium]
RLVGTLAHPLNRPMLPPEGSVVRLGYGIIQPRVSTSLPSASATRFARFMAGPAGTDPYTQAVSDVYQDLFSEGIYHGKAIYDLEAFAQVLGRRFPEATLLSHDLLEGAYLRVGLASDIELLESFPRNYQAFSARAHRWIRGDWQITAWCTPWVPGADGSLVKNPLSAINRWKIFDNLRRSLLAPASVALLVVGWLWLPDRAAVWSAMVGLRLLAPPLLQLIRWLTAPGESGRAIRRGWAEQGLAWGAGLFSISVLPHQALTAIDAIGRVWYRRLITHRNLLEWQTFQMVHQSSQERRRQFLEQIAIVSLFALVLGAVLRWEAPAALPAALPFLALWLLAPAAVVWSDGERKPEANGQLTPSDRQQLRLYARQTWRYFDDLVNSRTNWLPADNYQVALRVEVAARTSPTNVGLWLLSTLAAHDFGYLTPDQVIDRGAATLDTLRHLERFHGHLLNWYNAETLQPLPPRYVSTVDSGNLLASLWALAQGYRELATAPLIGQSALSGLADALGLLREALKSEKLGQLFDSVGVEDQLSKLASLIETPTESWVEVVARLRAAPEPARELVRALEGREAAVNTRVGAASQDEDGHDQPTSDAVYWASQIKRQIDSWLAVIDRYLGWLDRCDRHELPSVAPTLVSLASGECCHCCVGHAQSGEDRSDGGESHSGMMMTADVSVVARRYAAETLAHLEALTRQVDALADGMEMRFLYDPERRLFSIGYNVELRRLDRSYYDLLASEARLASLVAIARGEVPIEHWFTLGRPFGLSDGKPVLLSWTGTMFEYLMPLLLTRRYENSLLDIACREAVQCHIAYAKRRGVPWGISEAAFSAVDVNQIYQYQAFGVPDLGLKRGLGADLVVAPYATALALLIDAPKAVRNLQRLSQLGARGSYGFYDSIDFTPERRPEGKSGTVVATYMAHHQGMTLLAIDNVMHRGVLQQRFHADPRIRAFEPLLFERMPVAPPVIDNIARGNVPTRPIPAGAPDTAAHLTSPDTPTPRVHLLANGSYALMVTAAGGGYSRWRDFDVSRWRADTTLDSWGSFIYVRDVDRGLIWSATHQPICRSLDYSVTFASDRAVFARRDANVVTFTEIFVSTEADAEIRRVTLTNHSSRTRHLELTSYVELALAPHNGDHAHPAFSKLFVQTEAVPERSALLAWRKPRSPHDAPIWAAHSVVLPPDVISSVTYETDRAGFIGRGRGVENPVALERELSQRTGSVLDPIFSLRCRISVEPGQSVQLAFITGAAERREAVMEIVERYQDPRSVERAFELAAFRAQLELRHLRITAEDAQRFQQMAGHLLFPSPRLRAAEYQLQQNRLGQSRLWAYGISGDLPIMVVVVGDRRDADAVREALLAHAFWRMRGLWCDLVILNEEARGYQQPLQDYLKTLIQNYARYTGLDQPGGIFLRPLEHMPLEDLNLLLTVARVVLVAARGQFAQQLSQVSELDVPPPLIARPRTPEEPSAPLPFLELPYFNGLGGFTPDGREYAIYLGPGMVTPAPWVNVMANPSFGALVSESGTGFTWYGNSQSNRLLPWSNDPVVDPSGDAIYIRDEESGRFWTPTSSP